MSDKFLTPEERARAEALLSAMRKSKESRARDLAALAAEASSESYTVRMAAMRSRQRLFAALWMLGASWAKIGAAFGIRRESAYSSGVKYVESGIAGSPRDMTPERIAEYVEAWKEGSALEMQDMTSTQMVNWLKSKVDVEDAYLQTPEVDSGNHPQE